jgi:type II secretory pathway pseudopilin PulG
MYSSRTTHTILRQQRGAAFIVMLVILIIGVTAFLVSSLNSSTVQIKRDETTADALAQAKDALIGYAVTYGDNHPGQGYGYLPLPDLGSSRNGSPDEGNAAANFSGNTKNLTVIGRLPWRKLGLKPLQDGHGECLWYAVSGSFQNVNMANVLNWDSLGHFDTYSSNGTSPGTVSTTGSNYSKRPVAIIFSAGDVLQGQNRQTSITDTVSTCGGNYDTRNYLDSFNANTNINNIVNYFAGSTNNSTGYAYSLTSVSDGSQLSAAALSAPKNIIYGDIAINHVSIANDRILTITADDIFRPIIRRSDFSAQISALMNDPYFLTVLPSSTNKGTGNVVCASLSTTSNQTFCANWLEMLLLTRLAPASSITIDGTTTPLCNRVLIFGGQRIAGQVRVITTDKSNPANYIEGQNLAAFSAPTAITNNFSGPSTFNPMNPSADLLRCIP